MTTPKDSRVLILGGGAWGLSTALHMINTGYTDITVLERGEQIPSRYSAAWDLNKIVRAEYEDAFYTDLALDAISGWKTPLFAPYYHQTGYVVATTGRAPPKAIHHLQAALSTISSHPVFAPHIRALDGPEEFKEYTWQYTGPLTGFKGYFNRVAGYAHSADALKGVWEHLAGRGVKFVLGEEKGKVVELVYEGGESSSSAEKPGAASTSTSSPSSAPTISLSESSSTTKEPHPTSAAPPPAPPASQEEIRNCIGAKTADGTFHPSTLTICALGAYGATLLPKLGHFAVARCWSVAHVQLTDAEADTLRGIPTTNVRDLGFFFEPDPKTKLFKLCPLGAGYTNTGRDGTSLPPPERLPAPRDYIPLEDERKLRQLLRETFPWMAERPFVEQKMCWFSDTADSEYCIDFVPGAGRSLVALSGDSGHGFKMMPSFGKWVVRLLEEGQQGLERWRFRRTDGRGQDWAGAVSWRIGASREIGEVVEEKEKGLRARL